MMNDNTTFDFYEDTPEGVLESYTMPTEEDRWLLEQQRREMANQVEFNPLDPETMREMDENTMRQFDAQTH